MNLVQMNNDVLKKEAAYLYSFLFSETPSCEVISDYLDAHEALHLNADCPTVQKVCELQLDPISVEFVWRKQDPNNALTRKLTLLTYLAEHHAVLPSAKIKNPYWQIVSCCCKSLFHHYHGRYLMRRYQLCMSI